MILVISNCNILIFTSGGMGSKQRLWSRSWHHLTFYRNPLTARQRKRIVSRGEERGVRNLVRRLLFLWFTLPHSPSGPHLGFSELSVLRNKENSRPTEAQVIYYQQRDQNHRAGWVQCPPLGMSRLSCPPMKCVFPGVLSTSANSLGWDIQQKGWGPVARSQVTVRRLRTQGWFLQNPCDNPSQQIQRRMVQSGIPKG